MTTTQPPLAAALAETAAVTPTSIAATFDAANRERSASGTAPGLELEDRAPDFAPPDQLARVVRLGEQLTRGPVVLVFYRGDWCPYFNLTLRALQIELNAIHPHGAELLAVSPQTPNHALTLSDRHELEFPVLSDASQSTSSTYGLGYVVPTGLQDFLGKFGNDLREQNADGSWNLPVPATFVIDRGRVIRARCVDMEFAKRVEPQDVVTALAQLPRSEP